MLGLPLTFAAPLALAALVALPALWFLLRVTPPRPRRIDFPPLRIMADLLGKRETPARTPPWLLILRILAAACLILAVSGPVWNPSGTGAATGRTPLLVVLDNGFTAAHDWRDRLRVATDAIESAARDGRPVAVTALAEPAAALESRVPAAALERLRAIAPRPHLADRAAHLASLGAFLERSPNTAILWISDGVAGPGEETFGKSFADLVGRTGASLTILKADQPPALAISAAEARGQLTAHVLRAAPNGRDTGLVRALDQKGLPLAEHAFTFGPDATQADIGFDLPVELRNSISRIEVAAERSAGAVTLVDERGKRRRVGLVFGGTSDQAQPLLAPTYYLSRALSPYADVQEPGAPRASQNPSGNSSTTKSQFSSWPMSVPSTVRPSPASSSSSTRAASCCALPGPASPPATILSCRYACAAAAAPSAAPSPGTAPRLSRPSRPRALSPA